MATALTYNLGYFLRGLLLLPRVEEGHEVDQRNDQPEQKQELVKRPAAKKESPKDNKAPFDVGLLDEQWVEHIEKWTKDLEGMQTVGMLNTAYALIDEANTPKAVRKVISRLFKDAMERSGLVWDKENSMFVERKETANVSS